MGDAEMRKAITATGKAAMKTTGAKIVAMCCLGNEVKEMNRGGSQWWVDSKSRFNC